MHKADLPYSKNRKEEKEGSITLFKEEKRWYNYISTRMVFIVNKIVQIYNYYFLLTSLTTIIITCWGNRMVYTKIKNY